MKLVDYSEMLKDQYPRPGDRIKQYVIDQRREYAWERSTCPQFAIAGHLDNCGEYSYCSNPPRATWKDLVEHPHCSTCNDLGESKRDDEAVVAWLAQVAARPPIESDRSKLSDEIAEDFSPRPHPLLEMLKGRK